MDVSARLLTLFCSCLVLAFCGAQKSDPAETASRVLAEVNGTPITVSDVDLELLVRNSREEQPSEFRQMVLDQLIERELVLQMLKKSGYEPNQKKIRAQLRTIKQNIDDADKDYKTILKELGLNELRLKEKLEYTSMWEEMVAKEVGEDALKQYFQHHKEKFDGTEIHARQIFIKLPNDATEAQVIAALDKLADWKDEIEAGKIAFDVAAKKWSEAPSAADGGDLGFFPYRGKNPAVIATPAFQLKDGEIGVPFRSPFGAHLLTVVARRPGQFELEDVRAIVQQHVERELWRALVGAQRATAEITKTEP